MSYTFYRDKESIFECDVKVDGASLSDTSARLILTFENGLTTLYEGTVKISGDCEIKIPAIKEKLTESEVGAATLEVIAESTVFKPWTSDFTLKRSKIVTVEVADKKKTPSKPKLSVEVKRPGQHKDEIILEKIQEMLASTKKTQLRELVREFKGIDMSRDAQKWLKRVLPNDKTHTSSLIGKLCDSLSK